MEKVTYRFRLVLLPLAFQSFWKYEKEMYPSTVRARNPLKKKKTQIQTEVLKRSERCQPLQLYWIWWTLPQSPVALPSMESISWDLCPHLVPEGEFCQLCLFVVSNPCFGSVFISFRGIVADKIWRRKYSASSSAQKGLKTQCSLHTLPFKIKL